MQTFYNSNLIQIHVRGINVMTLISVYIIILQNLQKIVR